MFGDDDTQDTGEETESNENVALSDVNQDDPDGTTTDGGDAESGDKSDATSDTGTGTDETSEASGASDDKSDDNQRTSAYIRRLKREKRQAERELETERDKSAELAIRANISAEPKREDFESDDSFIDAKVSYEVAKQTPAPSRPAATGYASTLVDGGLNRVDAKFISDSMVEAQTGHKDFTATTTKADGLTKDVFEGLAEVDNPGEVLYYLSKHQKELSRISQLGDPKAIAVQLGRVEERMELGAAQTTASRLASDAPEPIVPVGGGKDIPGDDNSDALTDEEFFQKGNAELLRQRGLA